MERGQPRGRDPAQHEVLLVGQCGPRPRRTATASRASARSCAAVMSPSTRRITTAEKPACFCGAHAVGGPLGVAGVAARRPARAARGAAAASGCGGSTSGTPPSARIVVALGAVLGEERVGADLVDRPLEARLRLVVAVADAVEHAHDRVGGLEDLGDRHELLDDERAAAQRRQAAAGDQLEAGLAAAHAREEAEVVDERLRAVGAAAAAERRLELARQRRRSTGRAAGGARAPRRTASDRTARPRRRRRTGSTSSCAPSGRTPPSS